MSKLTHKYPRLIPAIYFMLLGAFFIVMEFFHNGFALYWFSIYAVLFLPILIPTRAVWVLFGLAVSLVFFVFLINGLDWFVEYLNGAYFRYPFDTFVFGFPFIIWSICCAVSIGYIGFTSEDRNLLRIKRAG